MNMRENLTIQEMDEEIREFCSQYIGTAIGSSIYNKRANTYDTDYEGIKDIWEEIQNL